MFAIILCLKINAQNHSHSHNHKHHGLHHWEIPSKDPDRIILNFHGDPATKRAVTWRTDATVKKGLAQIALAGVNSKFAAKAKTYKATTEQFDLGLYKSNNSFVVKIGQSGFNLKQLMISTSQLNLYTLEMLKTRY